MAPTFGIISAAPHDGRSKFGALDLLLLFLLCVCLPGCTTMGCPPKTNLIVADEQGRPLDPSPRYPVMSLNDYDTYLDAIFADLTNFCASRLEKPCRLLLFFHGGLNDHGDSICRAEQWQTQIRHAGYYPIFVSWDSSFPAAWWDHVAHVHQGVWTGNRWVWAAPYIAAKDEARSVAEAPIEWMAELRHNLPTLRGTGETGDLNRNAVSSYRDLVSASRGADVEFIKINDLLNGETLGGDDRKTSEKILPIVSLPLTIWTKLLGPPLVLEAAGVGAWDMMRRRTAMLFRTEGEMRGLPAEERQAAITTPPEPVVAGATEEIQEVEGARAEAALAYFITRFQEVFLPQFCQEKHRSLETAAPGHSLLKIVEEGDVSCDGRLEVTLVGHSMGTIIVDRLLRYAPNLRVKNIVFMAGASSIDDYRDTIEPYLAKNKNYTQMYHLILHPGAEVSETHFLHLVSNGSLLVWIDNYYTDPVTQQERTVGRFLNLMPELTNTPIDIRSQVHVKVFRFGREKRKWNPQEHGDFSIFPFWEERFWNPGVASDQGAPERLPPLQCGTAPRSTTP